MNGPAREEAWQRFFAPLGNEQPTSKKRLSRPSRRLPSRVLVQLADSSLNSKIEAILASVNCERQPINCRALLTSCRASGYSATCVLRSRSSMSILTVRKLSDLGCRSRMFLTPCRLTWEGATSTTSISWDAPSRSTSKRVRISELKQIKLVDCLH